MRGGGGGGERGGGRRKSGDTYEETGTETNKPITGLHDDLSQNRYKYIRFPSCITMLHQFHIHNSTSKCKRHENKAFN